MAKKPKKPQGITNTPQNNPNQTSKLDSKLSKKKNEITLKSKQQVDKDYYQRNKERKKKQRRERYQQKKLQTQLETQQQLSKYYTAEAIKILMSFKDYTELNPAKKKLWLDFNWTLQDCQKSFKEGYADVVTIMKLEQVAHNLISDFWDTAKSEKERQERHWNSLDYEEQQRLIRYWGYEKTRIENGYLEEEERLGKQSQEYLKAIELAKFHEERGKVKCPCYSCENKREVRKEVKAKMDKELRELEEQQTDREKGECCVCGKVKELDEDGICKRCSERYE